jgi:hypothetical protein
MKCANYSKKKKKNPKTLVSVKEMEFIITFQKYKTPMSDRKVFSDT